MQIEHSNEADLIQQTLAGDTAAFDQLVKTHRTVVYVLVLSYTKNPADAEDLTQRIFIRAYERLATLRQLDRFLPWLQQIAHNTCKNWLSRLTDSATTFEMVNHADFVKTAPSPEEIALKREIETVVREAIGALQETDRKLVEGRYIEGASYDELQVESGLSYAAIANRLKRAKQQMRRRIEKLLGGMVILPGRTLIWGGIETVKLSVKAKLAAVGVVAVLGIGGGVLYHTLKSNPNPVVMEITGGSLIDISHRKNRVSGSRSATGGESMSKFNEKVESVHTDAEHPVQARGSGKALAAMKLFNGMGGLTAEVLATLPLSEETRQIIEADQARIAGYYESGNVTTTIRTELVIKGELAELPIEIRQAIEKAKNSDGRTVASVDGNTIISVEGELAEPPPPEDRIWSKERIQAILSAETLQAVEDSDLFIRSRVQTSTSTPLEAIDSEVLEQWTEAYHQAYRELARLLPGASYQEREDGTYEFRRNNTAGETSVPPQTPSGSTESQSNPTDSVLTPPDESVESTTVSAERSEGTTPLSDQEWGEEDWRDFEQLLSEFSDEDWAEFERLLRASVGGDMPPQGARAPLNVERQQEIEKTLKKPAIDQPLNAERQRKIEKALEEVPIDPSALKELRRQRRVPPERDTRVPPRPKNVDRDRER